MADDVLRTRRMHREKLCAPSVFSVSAAVSLFSCLNENWQEKEFI